MIWMSVNSLGLYIGEQVSTRFEISEKYVTATNLRASKPQPLVRKTVSDDAWKLEISKAGKRKGGYWWLSDT